MPLVDKGLQPQPPFPWFAQAWQRALAKIHSHRMPHAWLIRGADGIGAVEFALATAQYLLCIAPKEASVCGRCKSCLLMKAETHPDLMELRPEGAGKAIKIDQVRDVGEFVAQTAQQGGRKVVLIHPAERMNSNAANALLKNLEEPIGACVFLLVSDEPAMLLATIRSRCQRLDLPPPAAEAAVPWLEERGVQQASARLLQAGGRPLRVLAWLELDLFAQRSSAGQVLAGVSRRELSPAEAGKALLKFDVLWLIEEVLRALADALRAREGVAVPDEESGEFAAVLALKSPIQLFDLYDKLLQSKRLLLSGSNPNPQLLLDDLMVDLSGAVLKFD